MQIVGILVAQNIIIKFIYNLTVNYIIDYGINKDNYKNITLLNLVRKILIIVTDKHFSSTFNFKLDYLPINVINIYMNTKTKYCFTSFTTSNYYFKIVKSLVFYCLNKPNNK